MSLKRAARQALDRAASLTGVLARLERAQRASLTILMYHRVMPDEQARHCPLESLTMPESSFRSQVAWVHSHFEIVPVREGIARLDNAAPNDRLLSFTFDDGYADNAEIAAPILDAADVRATYYLVTDFVGQGRAMWFDLIACAWTALGAVGFNDRMRGFAIPGVPALPPPLRWWMAALKALSPTRRDEISRTLVGELDLSDLPRAMSIEQARAMHERGHEIASHTVSHPLLPQLDDARLGDELAQSRRLIGQWLGEEPAGICYPNGDHDDRVVEAARNAGYTCACTTQAGINARGSDPMRLMRIDMTPGGTSDARGRSSDLAVRAQIALWHERVRRWSRS